MEDARLSQSGLSGFPAFFTESSTAFRAAAATGLPPSALPTGPSLLLLRSLRTRWRQRRPGLAVHRWWLPAGGRAARLRAIAEAECARAEVVALKEKLKALKALKTADSQDEHIEALETEIWERERAAREAQAAADAIDMAVFDLKAVNPNAVLKVDTRTSAEVIQSIEDHGKIVARALEALRTLLQA